MGPKLTVQNAEIKTAAVEIQTLTISGKQVTLAVFRQLQEEALIAEDATLKGEPWGFVNYHPDKCAEDKEHLHIVWQQDQSLLRSRVNAPWAASHEHPMAAHFLHAAIHEGLRVDSGDFAGIKGRLRVRRPNGNEGVTALFSFKGVEFKCEIAPEAARIYGGPNWGRRHYDADALSDWYGRSGKTAIELAESLPSGQYHGTWREMGKLPQLFIAV